MPAEYIIDVERGVVFSRGSGVFTHADYMDHMSRLAFDRNFNADFCQVVDCREITLMDITTGEIETLAKRSIFSVNARRAFVVSSGVQFGLSRMLASYREVTDGQKVMVFKEMNEALAWLNLPPESEPTRNSQIEKSAD